jgi:glycosyltransferase involved in cell wall biosynthesis
MSILYEDLTLRRKMAKNAYKYVKKKFDINIIAKSYIELYEELIG